MYEDYFAAYFTTDEELKKRIFDRVQMLTGYSPKKFNKDVLNYLDPTETYEKYLEVLFEQIPEIKDLEDCRDVLTQNEYLRTIAIRLEMLFLIEQLEYCLSKLIFMTFSPQMLGYRYIDAVEIIEEKFQEPLKYDVDKVFEILMKAFGSERSKETLIATKAAEEEITRVLDNEKEGVHFMKSVQEFENSIEDYISQNIGNLCLDIGIRSFFEAVIHSAKYINNESESRNLMTHTDWKELLDTMLKLSQSATKSRLRIKRGGSKKHKFAWHDEEKKLFYETVVSLPKINGEKMWEYAYEELKEKNFNFYIKEYLQKNTPFKNVPKAIFNKAIKTWEKYKESWESIPRNEKPIAFEFLHAIYLLDFPKAAFSSAENYFKQGKRLKSK